MTQYRIVEKYNNLLKERKFYPQIKKNFFWRSLKVHDQQTIENFYNTYDESKEFIISRLPKILFHCIEHPNSKEPVIYHLNQKTII